MSRLTGGIDLNQPGFYNFLCFVSNGGCDKGSDERVFLDLTKIVAATREKRSREKETQHEMKDSAGNYVISPTLAPIPGEPQHEKEYSK